MAINITAIGGVGTHTLTRVSVNSEENYIYFRDSDIPINLVEGASYIYADGIGSIAGIGDGSLVYTKFDSDQVLRLVDINGDDLDITGSVNGDVSLNLPVLYNNILNINTSTPTNQAVKYYTNGTPLTGLTSGETYF